MFKVYFADDEEPIVEELRSVIDWNEEGFEVCGYNTDAALALKEIAALRPDLVVSDIRMDISGLEVAAAINALDRDIAICFLSAYDKFEYARQAIRLRVAGYLTKPVKKAELLEVVASVKKDAYANFGKYLSRYFFAEDGARTRDKLRREISEKFPFLPPAAKARCVASGLGAEPFGAFSGAYASVRSEGKLWLGVCFGLDTEALSRECALRGENAGVSAPLGDYGYVLSGMKIASACAKNDFVTGWKGCCVYRESSAYARLAAEAERADDAAALEKFFADFSSALAGGLNVYDFGRLYEKFLHGARRLHLAGSEELSEEDIFSRGSAAALLDGARKRLFSKEEGGKSDVIREITENIALHIGERHSLGDYARRYSFNPSYLSQLFRKRMGESFMEYLMRVRLDAAKDRIAHTEETISDISFRVGFEDYYHFSKIFKKHVGVSPQEYRNKYGIHKQTTTKN